MRRESAAKADISGTPPATRFASCRVKTVMSVAIWRFAIMVENVPLDGACASAVAGVAVGAGAPTGVTAVGKIARVFSMRGGTLDIISGEFTTHQYACIIEPAISKRRRHLAHLIPVA